MHVTLKTMEKLDNLLDETEEYIKCANAHADDAELKAAYLDLARCHYNGYENLSRVAEQTMDRKTRNMPDDKASVVREMSGWYKDKFTERAAKIKAKMEAAR